MVVTLQILSYIVATIWFYVILKWDVEIDYKKWLVNVDINHTEEAIVRAVYLLPSHILLYWPKIHSTDCFWDYVLYAVLVIGVLFTLWWEFFDGWYNKKRGFKWRFNGSVDKDDALLDRLLYKIGDLPETILKWGLIITFLLSYILIR